MRANPVVSSGLPTRPMNVSFPGALRPLTTSPPPDGRTEKAAREFEDVLLASLFDSLQKSFCFDPQDDANTPGASDYRLMGTRALAEAVAAGGGIGIARLVLGHLQAPKGSGEK